MTFGLSDLPPVRGFWWLTLYNEHHFFAPNGLKRYSLGTKNKALTYGADGSTDISFGPSPPGEGKNWLKTLPDKVFFVILRLYGPTKALFNQTWKPSDLEKLPSSRTDIGAGRSMTSSLWGRSWDSTTGGQLRSRGKTDVQRRDTVSTGARANAGRIDGAALFA